MIHKPTAVSVAISFSLLTLTACGGGDDGDVQAPVISLNGDSPMLVAHGADFLDPGASVSDNVDTNLAVITSGTVDTRSVGSYNLTYSAVDSAGNSAEVSRVVNVTDQTAPVIALNGEATITVEQNSSFTDPGSSVTDNVEQALVATVSGSVDLSKVGSYTLTYDATDAAGNLATSIERTVNVTPITGQLSDILISGLAYKTTTQSGVTDEEGKFLYQAGEDISFSIGTTPIGDTVSAQKSMALTELLPQTTLYTTYGQLKNLEKLPDYHSDKVAFFRFNNTLSLLHSVDDDSNPDNGINIPEGLLQMFTGDAIDLEQHFFYLAGKGRRWGEGDKPLKRILQPAAAEGLLDNGDIVSYGIALDSYYRMNEISHSLEIRTITHTDSDGDGSVDKVYKELYSDLGDRIHKEQYENDLKTYTRTYTYDDGGRQLNYSNDSDGDGSVNSAYYRSYDSNGNEIKSESDDDGDGVVDSRFTEEFDSVGNGILTHYDSDGNGTPDYVSTYTYDAVGNNLSYSYDNDGDGQVDDLTVYTYDLMGNRLTSTGYSDNRVTKTSYHEFTYDDRGNQTSSRYDWDGDGQVEQIATTTFDSNSNQLVNEQDNDADGSIDWRNSYTYDANGYQILRSFEEVGVNSGHYYYTYDDKGNRLTYEKDTDADGTIDTRYISTFDVDGNELTDEYDSDNDGTPNHFYRYTYNSNGNMLSESRDTDGDGAVDETITYTHSPSSFRAVIYDIF
ncbi:immunoglobulin-like domain-containing protein [Shewanella sp. 125m-7]